MATPYRLLEHTSDIKVEICGQDLTELFRNAAFCLFDLMLEVSRVEPKEQRELILENDDLSELFLDWLRELLFLFSARGFALSRAEVRLSPAEIARPFRLSATLRGETYDPARHGLKVEVKTPTYHEYKLEQTRSGFRATLVLDV